MSSVHFLRILNHKKFVDSFTLKALVKHWFIKLWEQLSEFVCFRRIFESSKVLNLNLMKLSIWHSQYPKYEKNIVITAPTSYLGAYMRGRSPKNVFCLKIGGGGGSRPPGPFPRSANELSIVIYCNFKVSDFSANRSPAVRHSVAANINLCSLTVLLLVSRRLRSHFILTTSAHWQSSPVRTLRWAVIQR